jgi:CTP-dependent riboflavin kinase
LNLKLDEEGKRLREAFEVNPKVVVSENGYCRGKCFKARFGFMEVVVVLPEVEGYPDDVLEVVAPVNLRRKFGLKDGDLVVLSILLE